MHYSLLGYLNAVRLRSEKTLLVEGPSDQKLLGRFRHEVPNRCGQIDATEILGDPNEPSFAGKGSREKILQVIDALQRDPKLAAIVNGKLGTLTDREWDGVTVGREVLDGWQPPVQWPPNFVTRGHSIENYFFSKSSFKAYLKLSFPENLTDEFLNMFDVRFPQMVALAFSWSITIRNLKAIKRANGLSFNHVQWSGEHYILRPSIVEFLSGRGVEVPENFEQEIERLAKDYLQNFAHEHPGVWLCHGHLGEELLWACVASLASELHLQGALPDRIEKADKQLRHRYLCDHLSQDQAELHVPLKDAVEWLHS